MKWIVDKLEEGFAEIESENGKLFTIPVFALPKGVKEKDVIVLSLDENETLEREKRINNLMNDLFTD